MCWYDIIADISQKVKLQARHFELIAASDCDSMFVPVGVIYPSFYLNMDLDLSTWPHGGGGVPNSTGTRLSFLQPCLLMGRVCYSSRSR